MRNLFFFFFPFIVLTLWSVAADSPDWKPAAAQKPRLSPFLCRSSPGGFLEAWTWTSQQIVKAKHHLTWFSLPFSWGRVSTQQIARCLTVSQEKTHARTTVERSSSIHWWVEYFSQPQSPTFIWRSRYLVSVLCSPQVWLLCCSVAVHCSDQASVPSQWEVAAYFPEPKGHIHLKNANNWCASEQGIPPTLQCLDGSRFNKFHHFYNFPQFKLIFMVDNAKGLTVKESWSHAHYIKH